MKYDSCRKALVCVFILFVALYSVLFFLSLFSHTADGWLWYWQHKKLLLQIWSTNKSMVVWCCANNVLPN